MIIFENILPILNKLFLEKLPLYIERINKEKNDGIILKPFENNTLFENCQKLPCFNMELQQAEYSEKDRIIENTVFEIQFEIKTKSENENKVIEVCRYMQAVDEVIKESEKNFVEFRIIKAGEQALRLRIVY